MLSSDKTTELAALRKGAKFTWGKVIEILDIAQYTMIAYNERGMNTEEPTGRRLWSVYVDGKYTGQGTTTLEKAMLLAVACGNPDVKDPGMAAHFAAKVLSLTDD